MSRAPRSSRMSWLLALTAAALAIGWSLYGPEPDRRTRGVLLMGMLVGGLSWLATAASPNRWFNALVFPGIFATGLFVAKARQWFQDENLE